MSYTTENKKIAQNTLVLYIRMILILCIGLYTSRVVLNTLGIIDYGLYNIVGGFVTLLTFLNGAMSTATQRFITFELASGTFENQKKTFSMSLIIHFTLALIIFFFAETIGLWLVYNKLVIPEERLSAAIWVYQLSVGTCIINIISIPYNALIIAHEKMSAFAYISILDVILKLIIVYLLTFITFDKLIFYAIFIFLIGILNRLIYGIYCSSNFSECKFTFIMDKKLLKRMTNIAGWSLFGNIAGIGYTQGLNILLNMFFGPSVNAARGVAVTVQGIVSGFVSNFQMAINPQITKSYATKDFNRMYKLIYTSSKFSFILLSIIIIPVIIEAELILKLWLNTVPEYSIVFLKLILSILLVDSLANPLMISSQATGKVKFYQIIVGTTLLMIVPIAYIYLKMGANPYSVFIVHLIIAIIAQVFRTIIISKLIKMPIMEYINQVVLRILPVFFLSFLPIHFINNIIPNTNSYHLILFFITVLNTILISISLGLTRHERNTIIYKIRTSLNKQR